MFRLWPRPAVTISIWSGQMVIRSMSRARRACRKEKAVNPPAAMTKPRMPGSRNSGTAMTSGRPRMPASTSPIQPPAARNDLSGRKVAENKGLVVVLVCIGMMDSP